MKRLSIFFLLLLSIIIALSFAQDAATTVDETERTTSETAADAAEDLDLDELLVVGEAETIDDLSSAQKETKEPESTTKTTAETIKEDEPEAPDTDTTSTADSEESSDTTTDTTTDTDTTTSASSDGETNSTTTASSEQPEQIGPFIDLLGNQLYALEVISETQVQLVPKYTNEVLQGKQVVGLYFSADWCGPCRKFTPDLVTFYQKMNARRGHKDDFQIVWVSRCRDVESYGQYFTQMPWLALPPEEAMGQRGQMLSGKYKVKGIPTLVLLDDLGNVITTDARNKIPADKAGVGFPWRNPLVQLYTTIFPRTLRMMVKGQVDSVKGKLLQRFKVLVGMKPKATS